LTYNPHFNDEGLRRYFHEIGRYSLLTKSEEYDLGRNIRLYQDPSSLEKLVNSNLRFVVSVAKRFQGNGLSLKDLIAEGNIGLVKAAERFDERRDFRFISYAVWWIRQSIQKALSEQVRTVKIPINRVSILLKMNRYCSEYETLHGQEPTQEHLEERFLSDEKESTRKTIMRSFYENRRVELSLDAEDEDDKNPKSLYNLLVCNQPPPTEDIEYISDQEAISEELASRLNQREQEIILKYYYEGKSLEEIGQDIGLTRERVRQLKVKALKKLSRSSRIKEMHAAL